MAECEETLEQTIEQIVTAYINRDLISIILSNSIEKEKITKLKVRPVLLKGELLFQSSEYIGTKVMHKNLTKEQAVTYLEDMLKTTFRQGEIITKTKQINILISKKGKETIKIKNRKAEDVSEEMDFSHNRAKNYILSEGMKIPFLVDLGVMTTDGKIVKTKTDKFRQINRFLEYVEDVLPYLDKKKELKILDFGCGKSYLTFAIYYYLREMKGYDLRVIGLDLKEDVITNCNELSKRYGYEKLTFLHGDVASYEDVNDIDMMVTLHACDTATDYALYKAVKWNAKVILSVPCCQHELNRQISCETLQPILKYGLIKERMAALMTDALRANLLEEQGYQVQVMEFIDMEHTPKNILIRAVKNQKTKTIETNTEKLNQKGERVISSKELADCMEFLRVSPTLEKLLR